MAYDWKNLNQEKIESSAEGYDRHFSPLENAAVSNRAKKRLRGMIYGEEAGETKPDDEKKELESYGIFKGIAGNR